LGNFFFLGGNTPHEKISTFFCSDHTILKVRLRAEKKVRSYGDNGRNDVDIGKIYVSKEN
jgi:hypothetical protein